MASDSEYIPDLDGFIESGIYEFERELETMWSDREYGATVNAFAARVAELILESSERLLTESDPSIARELPDLLTKKGLHADVVLALQLVLAQKYLPDTASMARRCMDLIRLVVRANASEPVRRFLRRVARCYMSGLGNECVVVCRAVVENALTDKFEQNGIPLPATNQGKSPMRTRLDAATKMGWLSQKSRNDAWTVWVRGNKAVHDDPEAVNQDLDTIRLTMGVLDELYVSNA